METTEFDANIRNLRHKAHRAKSIDQCYEYLQQLNTLQRERFAKFGRFLEHKNGKVYTYNIEEDMWLAF